MYFKTLFKQLIYVTLIISILSACNQKRKASNDGKNATDSSITESESVKAISKQIENDPENAELYYQRARIYVEQKYLDKALFDMEDAILLEKQNPLYYFQKGRILYAMNRTKEAAKAYESAISFKPDYEEAQVKLAELYYVVKEHQKSIDLLNVILSKDALNANAMCLKADNQRDLKDTLRAIASYQKTLEIDDKYYDANMQLGLIFAAKKNPISTAYFSAAIRLNPRSAEAYFGRAYYYQLTKQFQKALFDYRKVINLNPSSDLSYYNVGIINFDAQKYDEALRSWDICIEMNNQNIEAYYMRGLVYEYRKNNQDAILNYKYALALNPNYTLAQEAMDRMKHK